MSALCGGNTHDITAFTVSSLARYLRENGLPAGFWIAADNAYECQEGILTPWARSQTDGASCQSERDAKEGLKIFQSTTRSHVEKAFGLLLNRFGVLWRPLRFDLSFVSVLLSVCIQLHNFCID